MPRPRGYLVQNLSFHNSDKISSYIVKLSENLKKNFQNMIN